MNTLTDRDLQNLNVVKENIISCSVMLFILEFFNEHDRMRMLNIVNADLDIVDQLSLSDLAKQLSIYDLKALCYELNIDFSDPLSEAAEDSILMAAM